MFKMSVLGIDQQARRNRKGGALGLVGQPRKAERAANSNRPLEDPGGEFQRSGKLRGPAAQNDTDARRLWEAAEKATSDADSSAAADAITPAWAAEGERRNGKK